MKILKSLVLTLGLEAASTDLNHHVRTGHVKVKSVLEGIKKEKRSALLGNDCYKGSHDGRSRRGLVNDNHSTDWWQIDPSE